MKLVPALTILSLAIAGCALTTPTTQTSRQINALSEKPTLANERLPGRYSLLTPQATGVVDVFEDGNRTMIQFARGVPEDLMLVDAAGKMLRFDRYSNYAIVQGQYEGILMRSGGGQSYATTGDASKVTLPAAPEKPGAATAEKPTAPATAVQPATEPADARKPSAAPMKSSGADGDPAEVQAMRSSATAPVEQLAQAEHHLRTVEAEMTAQHPPHFTVAQIMKTVASLETKLEGLNATLVRVRFAVGRARIELPEAAQQAFKRAAEASDRIEVRGRTDSQGSARVNSRVAYDRAMAAKAYLQNLGVPAEKIRVSALPMADYVADNTSAEGRARNRRVDFVFVAPNADSVKVSLDTPTKE